MFATITIGYTQPTDMFSATSTAIRQEATETTTILPSPTQTTSYPYEINFFTLAFKTLIALGIIAFLIYFVLRFFFRIQGYPLVSGASLINILLTIPCGPNKYIQMVEVVDRILILGIAEKGINCLSEITSKESIDLIKTQLSQQEDTSKTSFSQYLKRFLPAGRVGSILSGHSKIEFLARERERLKLLR